MPRGDAKLHAHSAHLAVTTPSHTRNWVKISLFFLGTCDFWTTDVPYRRLKKEKTETETTVTSVKKTNLLQHRFLQHYFVRALKNRRKCYTFHENDCLLWSAASKTRPRRERAGTTSRTEHTAFTYTWKFHARKIHCEHHNIEDNHLSCTFSQLLGFSKNIGFLRILHHRRHGFKKQKEPRISF